MHLTERIDPRQSLHSCCEWDNSSNGYLPLHLVHANRAVPPALTIGSRLSLAFDPVDPDRLGTEAPVVVSVDDIRRIRRRRSLLVGGRVGRDVLVSASDDWEEIRDNQVAGRGASGRSGRRRQRVTGGRLGLGGGDGAVANKCERKWPSGCQSVDSVDGFDRSLASHPRPPPPSPLRHDPDPAT